MIAIFSAPSRVLAWLSSPVRLPLIDRLDLRAPLPLKGAVFSFPDALADLRKPLSSPEASLATAIAQDEARLAGECRSLIAQCQADGNDAAISIAILSNAIEDASANVGALRQELHYADSLAHLADEGWVAVGKPARKPRARKPALTTDQKAERMAKALAKATAPKAPRKARKVRKSGDYAEMLQTMMN
jgi:hypothetical protein